MSSIEIAVFEDESSVRGIIQTVLEGSPYQIAVEAVTRQEAFDAVAAMHAGELSIRAVLLDGNLDNKPKVLFSDAHAIYNRMHELELTADIPVIGISSEKLAAYGVPIPKELDVTKWSIINNLVPTLDSLDLQPHD